MKLKRTLFVGLALVLAIGITACTKNNEKPSENTGKNPNESVNNNEGYMNYYSTSYNDYIAGLNRYSIYDTPESINNQFKDKEYPGNVKYLSDVKAAYKDSRDKIQSFVTSLKKDGKTEDTELKKMNDDLIAEGERLVKDIDKRIEKLDKVSDEDMKKGQNDFIKLVHGTEDVGNDIGSGFRKMIKDMNDRLGITGNNKK
ncbi:hypothetical protein SIK49_13085 [Clostridioides difficile]|uniref:hypothetical protein n=1 Tax=Clostridioides difficile TaxID=1496 RepID=UPI0029C567EA|nr:hypothetical protein [Clostridioides difficile]MDX5700807.1 hypothetical protein [Clostridioides difficile]